jgi:predicted ABC-type ATPase
VLAGVNGAGKSSIGGAAIREAGAEYYNPDEAATKVLKANPHLSQMEANAVAWQNGRLMLERAIRERLDFAFETTLGASTMTELLVQAAEAGFAVHVWYAGLASPEQHIERVRARVRAGGHDIADADIRRRYRHSRLNLIRLLPFLASLRVFDNSVEADPATGRQPMPRLVLHLERGTVKNPGDMAKTPDWAKPVVAAVLKSL